MMDDFTSAEIQTGETSVFVRSYGAGPPILLLHGLPETHLMWRGVAPLLARDFTVVCADLRGYGRSGCPVSAPDHAPYAKRAMARKERRPPPKPDPARLPRPRSTLGPPASPLAERRTFTIYVFRGVRRPESSDGFGMRPTLLESDRSFFQSAECAFVSILAHAGLVWLAVGATQGGRQIPTDEREARVFFLLPPDRVDVRSRQTEVIQWGKLGGDLEDGKNLMDPSEGRLIQPRSHGARPGTDRSGARGELPFGPVPPFDPDTAFSVLEVDEVVQRYESSAAPIYPHDLLAIGAEGLVQAIYVVDTTGLVDTTTIQVVQSNDPRFTASVVTALGQMRFRPATRAGERVRQLVEQQFRFRIIPASQVAKQVS